MTSRFKNLINLFKDLNISPLMVTLTCEVVLVSVAGWVIVIDEVVEHPFASVMLTE